MARLSMTILNGHKVYWAGRSPSNHLRRSDGFPEQINHGIHFGNKSVHHSRGFKRPAWNLVGDLRRGDLGRMVVRFAPAACGPVGGVRSAQERAAQTWQQK